MIRFYHIGLLLTAVTVAACVRGSGATDAANLHEAQALIAAGDCNDAVPKLEQVASRTTAYSIPYRALATCYLSAGSYEDALTADNKGLTIAPNDYHMLMQRSEAYFGLGHSSEAVTAMQDAERNAFGDPIGVVSIAQGYQSIQDCNDAERVLTRVVRGSEPPVSAYLIRAACYTSDQRYKLAEADLHVALRVARAPDDRVQAWLSLAQVYSKLLDTGRAIAAAAAAQQSNPGSLSVAVNAGTLLSNLATSSGDTRAANAALPYLDRVLGNRTSPYRQQALVSKADALRSIGRFKEAAALYEEAVAESKDPAFIFQIKNELSSFSH